MQVSSRDSTRMHRVTLSILIAVLLSNAFESAPTEPKNVTEPPWDFDALENTSNVLAESFKDAAADTEALVDKLVSAVDQEPEVLVPKVTGQFQGGEFAAQKAGSRSIMMGAQQGFNGIFNHEPSTERQPVNTYPAGLGPVLLNQCTEPVYAKTSPCYKSKVVDLQSTICENQIDASNFIGVGFDGRGYYRAESRRGSLIQRACSQKASFLGQDVPDTMNVYGIFETIAETKSFQSTDEYMSFIRNKAGLTNQQNLFSSEAGKDKKASGFGFNLRAIGSFIGAAIGSRFGGPLGSVGARLGGEVGGAINGGEGSGNGSQSATENKTGSSEFRQAESEDQKQSSNQNFFAVMYVNVVLYEISLDDVKPSDINLAALRDYMSLPVSYFSTGADVKYQNFLLRWGTHFIRSSKFGGQLKITKTAKKDKIQSVQEFASIAETEFQSMFATLKSKWSQESGKYGFWGLGGSYSKFEQNDNAETKSNSTSKMYSNNDKSYEFRQSEFTQTSVEAQGGSPEIAEALVDFYTPAFKELFHKWILSIKDYPKPFDFQLRPINELFNLNMDSLFPAGNTDFGCVGGSTKVLKTLLDPKTNKTYYVDKYTELYNDVLVEKQTRVNCLYSDINDFQQDMEKRSVSLERAVGIYMTEGPFPTSSFEVQGGEPGCEEVTLAQFRLFGNASQSLKFSELQKHPFIIAFDLPAEVPDVVTIQAKYVMTYRFERWFAVEPNQELVNLYDGCQIANVKATSTKVCFRNIILTYEESTGFFHITSEDFAVSKHRNPLLPYWLSGTTVARASSDMKSAAKRAAVPCNVQWLNSHRLDPAKPEHCIHFAAASEGDLFVIFASIPKDHSTWYYLQITTEGANFYHSMKLWKSDLKKGIGMLGDKNLFQSFFVCIIQQAGGVTLQYGKADPDSEVGSVYAAYTFPPEIHFNPLTFYSLGSGNRPVSLMDIRRTKKMPQVACQGSDMVKVDGKCVLDCHPECDGCIQAKENKRCHQCRHVRLETRLGDTRVVECLSVCPPGTHLSDAQPGLCTPCSAGTFKATHGNEECEQCPVGQYALGGAPGCTDCPAGTFSEAGQAECEKCPLGHFGNSTGMSECQSCAVGYFAHLPGMTSCLKCATNSFAKIRGSANCTQCLLGYYQPDSQLLNCTIAPKGFFVSIQESGVLKPCPMGTFNDLTGQSQVEACRPCPAGSYSAQTGSDMCALCPPGQYQHDTGTSRCVLTEPGFYADVEGQTDQKVCPAGHYSSADGAAKCIRCTTASQDTPAGSTECGSSRTNSASLCTKAKMFSRLTLNNVGSFPGGRIMSHRGFQTSLEYPRTTYHSNMNCSWTISPPDSATWIRLIIRQVDLETNLDNKAKCSFDNLTISFENAATRQFEQFFTCNQPATLTSSNNITIQFRTDGKDERTGFLLEWYFIPSDCNCASRLGCFKDKHETTRAGRDLSLGYNASSHATAQFCHMYCKARGFRYVGLQAREWCYCGNSYGRHGRKSDSECQLPCKGNKSATCGGYGRNEIFETGL